MATGGSQPAEGTSSTPGSVDLQIMSPSPGVPQPWLIRGIPPTTSVRQLKERLRNVLEARPADNAQRLIHRGRLLARDDETLLGIFGEDAVCSHAGLLGRLESEQPPRYILESILTLYDVL